MSERGEELTVWGKLPTCKIFVDKTLGLYYGWLLRLLNKTCALTQITTMYVPVL